MCVAISISASLSIARSKTYINNKNSGLLGNRNINFLWGTVVCLFWVVFFLFVLSVK